MFKELDPLLHSQLRLAVMSILIGVESADFVYLREQTESTAGNLSIQLDKLAASDYISVEKTFVGKKTRTICSITETGKKAFEEYVRNLKDYIENKKSAKT
jgi:DNA-binding MarR family transcriptional regulator